VGSFLVQMMVGAAGDVTGGWGLTRLLRMPCRQRQFLMYNRGGIVDGWRIGNSTP
jgi:hypothetical protein